jgi:hypothetical protein
MFRGLIYSDQLRAAAESVLSMVRTIRQHLPVQGDVGSRFHTKLMRLWLRHAREAYTSFERVRNPNKLPWPESRESFFAAVFPSRVAMTCWQELCHVMAPVVEHYGWEGISDDSESMKKRARLIDPATLSWADIPVEKPATPIDPETLDRVEIAACVLLAEFTARANDAPAATENTEPPTPKPGATEPPKPNRYLIGWNDILDKLGLADERTEYLRTLNVRYRGPIILTQGAQPKVDVSELVAWWNGLREIWKAEADTLKAEADKQRDAQATVADIHGYGHDDQSVVPEISGGVKRRPSGRNAK